MKDYVRKGILASQVLATEFYPDVLQEQVVETKPSRVNRKSFSTNKPKVNEYERRKHRFDEFDD